MPNTSASTSVDRPNDDEMLTWFRALCTWLENESDTETELYTLEELHAQIDEIAGDGEVYRKKRPKQT